MSCGVQQGLNFDLLLFLSYVNVTYVCKIPVASKKNNNLHTNLKINALTWWLNSRHGPGALKKTTEFKNQRHPMYYGIMAGDLGDDVSIWDPTDFLTILN